MASNINYISIDETYPIAGQDNDTQGFRDNFGYIKNNFEAAKGEIEDLQLNGARVDDDNDFNNFNIVNANFVSCSDELYDGGSIASTTLVDRQNGSYHIYQVTGGSTIQLTLAGFPSSGRYGSMRVQISSDGTERTIIFGISGAGSFLKDASVPTTITVTNATSYKVFEFWTYNGANTVFMKYLGEFTGA